MNQVNLKIETRFFIDHVRKNADSSKPLIFWIDLFCGAGGTSTGIHFTDIPNMFVAACVNHDANAILSHALNHPNTLHFTEDIRDFKLSDELLLKEWDNEKQEYTGRILHRRIDYILKGGQFGLEEGYVIMGISKV